jgi:aminopeptidase N
VGVTGNDPAVQQRARALAAGYIADPSSLPATLAPAVLQVAALGGDRALYDQYLAQLQKAANEPEEYYRFLNALTWFRDPALVQRTLAYALSDAVRTQDTGTVIGQLIARGASRAAAWTFAKAEWRTITQKLGTFQGIPTIVTAVGAFCSAREAADVRAFFGKNPVPAAERTLQQAIERIESCVAVDERQSKPFAAWLAAR